MLFRLCHYTMLSLGKTQAPLSQFCRVEPRTDCTAGVNQGELLALKIRFHDERGLKGIMRVTGTEVR